MSEDSGFQRELKLVEYNIQNGLNLLSSSIIQDRRLLVSSIQTHSALTLYPQDHISFYDCGHSRICDLGHP